MKTVVIIVTYNGIEWIENCIQSILKSNLLSEIIVIDNCSTDETVNFIKEKFSEIILLEQKINLGFGKANNIGMAYALKKEADFVFLLNQDTVVEKDTIEKLVSTSIHNPEYGLLSPVQLNYSGELLEQLFFRFMATDLSREFYSDFVLGKNIKKIYDIDFVQAAAWFIPISTLKRLGGFDPIFFHYGEDNNYCQRVLFHKMKIGVVPFAYIRHDSFTGIKPISKLFSKKYFEEYQKELYVRYGDLNTTFSGLEIKKEKNKISKRLIRALFTFNFPEIRGFWKKHYILSASINQIKNSRNTNLNIEANYL